MYFKKLEIVGFKSFVDKTILHFDPGITAVVGPNGTGKSNIFDSIRWVLGEQSAKSMRGCEMQDVIFNGTDSKEPLGMAEVSLTFDNEKRFFALDHNEVVVTRRIFRSGESEYLLNKTPVRLKDILDLLMGTGIGSENYSLVEQGKIDLLLSSRPEDRRLVFDEAAGITKYKAQKKEALRKLEETEQNLLRVNDIIAEVKRQIGSLERQANKARKYKEIFTELKSKEINLAVLEINALCLAKNNVINQLKQLQMEEEGILTKIQEGETKINNHRQELKAFADKVMAIKNQILNMDNSASNNAERINFNREKTAELEQNQKNLSCQIEQTKSRLILDEKKLKDLKDEHESINKNMEAKKALLGERETQLNNLSASIKSSLENIAATKRDILEIVSKASRLKNEMTDLTSRQQVYLARKKRLEIEKSKVNEEKAQTNDNLNNLALELKEIQASFDNLNSKAAGMKIDLQQQGLSLDKLKTDIDNLEKEKLTLRSHLEFLDKLKTKYKDISESMNAIIYLDKPPVEKITGLVVKITDYLQAAGEDKSPGEFTNFKLSGEAKPIDFDTQKINEKLQRIEQETVVLENTKNASYVRIEELNKTISELQGYLRQKEMALVNKKASQQTALEEFDKINEEENIIVAEISDVQGELSIVEEKLANLKLRLEESEKEQKGCEDLILDEQNNINLNNELKEAFLITITQTKTELEALSKQLYSDRATFDILNDTCQQDKAGLASLQTQLQDNDHKKKAMALEIDSLEKSIEQMRINIQSQNETLKETEGKYQGISKGVSDVTEGLRSDRKELDIIKNKLYALQMQDKDTDFKISSIKMRISQSYKVDLDISVEIKNQVGDNPTVDKNALWGEIERLKEKLDACGTVNLVAIEEYDELKKRYDFLTQQQSDLTSAKDSVHEAILKINRTTKKMFLETFEKVRLEFRNYFKVLFNGGDAQIFLIDENEPLESGIEIICRPPGKKLQNVLLLSGGEKSLSAIALIFAIFKVKPSLFCVLDEIDAALDEANVDRLGRILQEFAKESQFIVITHNKKTIANANVMYGITMQESGVSKIVSVKFAGNKMITNKEPDAVGVSA